MESILFKKGKAPKSSSRRAESIEHTFGEQETTPPKRKVGPRPSISDTSTPVQPPWGVRGPWCNPLLCVQQAQVCVEHQRKRSWSEFGKKEKLERYFPYTSCTWVLITVRKMIFSHRDTWDLLLKCPKNIFFLPPAPFPRWEVYCRSINPSFPPSSALCHFLL